MATAIGYLGGIARSIGRGMIPDFIKWGWNRTKALDYLKTTSGGYRKKVFLKDWAQIASMKQKADPLKYVRKDYRPTPDTITPTGDRQHQKFKYIYKAEILDKVTGEFKEHLISIGSDYRRTMGVMSDMAAGIATSFKYGKDLVLVSLVCEAVLEKTY